MMGLACSAFQPAVQNLAFRRDALAHTACFEKPIDEIGLSEPRFRLVEALLCGSTGMASMQKPAKRAFPGILFGLAIALQ